MKGKLNLNWISWKQKKKKTWKNKNVNRRFIFVTVVGIGCKYEITFIFPDTDRGAMFLFANGDKDVFEVAIFAEGCRSWLIDNTVQQGKELWIYFKNKIEDKEGRSIFYAYERRQWKGGTYLYAELWQSLDKVPSILIGNFSVDCHLVITLFFQ